MSVIDFENDRFLRLSEVVARTGLSESTIYRRMSEKTFPRSVSLSPNCVRWLLSEIQEWAAGCLKARDAGGEASQAFLEPGAIPGTRRASSNK